MSNRFSERSLAALTGVHPDMVKLAHEAIKQTRQDFTVIEGLRTIERQRKLVASGASKTLASRHIDGFAIGCAPFLPREDVVFAPEKLFTVIAEAFRAASLKTKIPVRWGRAWEGVLTDFSSASAAMDHYVKLRRSQGRRPFLDGPHFELPRAVYP